MGTNTTGKIELFDWDLSVKVGEEDKREIKFGGVVKDFKQSVLKDLCELYVCCRLLGGN